jgi:hypothetical protein
VRFATATEDGDLKPDGIISQRLPLADARGCKIFNEQEEDRRNFVMTPQAPTLASSACPRRRTAAV